jgi:hypothetical protein
VSDLIAGFTPHGAIVGTHTGEIASGTGTGLQVSFLIMLIALFGSGWFLWRARPSYPRDVATAGAGWTPGGGQGEDETVVQSTGPSEDATVVQSTGPSEDATVVQSTGPSEAPTVNRPAGEDEDDTEPLVRPR